MEGTVNMDPPSEDEKYYYYCGLPSRPIPVARTGTDPWMMHEAFHGVYKRPKVVQKHAIKGLWNDESRPLRQQVIECLEGVEWVAIDILRLGYEKLYEPKDQESDRPPDSLHTSQLHFPVL
jgi:hypothetical protein